ncbi:hypothetical protein M0813_12791 [Anaeramoeba flamelloides]|uniref:Uncharacterized protein n=1 Tax=Anaeramoeba flamelloides TaxID=1746091 RepID=A0ABQ8ZBT1_9EUKA|nr:hypothetical protein M0813_12791 [Anaeramoeba flamelloides]
MNKKQFLRLKKEFKKTRCYRKRLKKIIKLRRNEIQGLNPKYLRESYINKLHKTHGPKEIRIKRSCLDFLSKLTDRKRKTLERGITTFFTKNYNLTNTRNYSREWMFFGPITSKKPRKNQPTTDECNSKDSKTLTNTKPSTVQVPGTKTNTHTTRKTTRNTNPKTNMGLPLKNVPKKDQKKKFMTKMRKKAKCAQKTKNTLNKILENIVPLNIKTDLIPIEPLLISPQINFNEISEDIIKINPNKITRKRIFKETEPTSSKDLNWNQKQMKTLPKTNKILINDMCFENNFQNYFEMEDTLYPTINTTNENKNVTKNETVKEEMKFKFQPVEEFSNDLFFSNLTHNNDCDIFNLPYLNQNFLYEDVGFDILGSNLEHILMPNQEYNNFI